MGGVWRWGGGGGRTGLLGLDVKNEEITVAIDLVSLGIVDK